MLESQASSQQDATSVFLSYSRRDVTFVSVLARELSAIGYDVVYDVSHDANPDPDKNLTAQDEWWSQLQTMIAAADVMVLVVTPESAASRECAREILHARHCGRRIIPILRTPITFETAPDELRRLNIQIDFTGLEPDAFASALAALREQIDTDIAWHRDVTRLSRRAHQWESSGRPEGELMRQAAIDRAEKLLFQRPSSAPDAFPALLAFLDASRQKEADDRRRLLTIIGRAYVKPARRALDDGYYDTALRYAAAGALLGEDVSMSLVPERDTESRIRLAAYLDRTRLVLRLPGERFEHVTFDAQGLRLAAASDGQYTHVWDLQSAREIPRIRNCGHTGDIRSIAISPDGSTALTTGSDKLAKLSILHKGLETKTLEGHRGDVLCGDFSPDGQKAATGSEDGTTRIWDVASGRTVVVLKGHDTAVASCRFSPDGKRIATGSHDRTARIWNALNGKQLARIAGHSGWVLSVSWRPDGKAIATASTDHSVLVSNAKNGKRIARLEGHSRRVNGVTFSPDGKRLASASDDFTAIIWNASNGAPMDVLRGHTNNVAAVCFSPDGRLIATGSHDNTIRTWDASVDPLIWKSELLTGSIVIGCRFEQDGIHVSTRDGEEHILDEATGALRSPSHRSKKRPAGTTREPSSIIESPDGRREAVIERLGEVTLRDRTSGQDVRLDLGLNASIKHASFSPDATRVLTGSGDGVARIWDSTSGALLASTEPDPYGVDGIGFSPDGGRFFTIGSEPFASIWDVQSGALIARLGQSRQRAAAFSGDGRSLLLVADDGSASLHDVGRTQALAGAAAEILAAALANGKGGRPATERRDLLLQDAPADLHAALLEAMKAGLETTEAGAMLFDLQYRISLLSEPLHKNCYSPRQHMSCYS
jgi:WD40 repeat protein